MQDLLAFILDLLAFILTLLAVILTHIFIYPVVSIGFVITMIIAVVRPWGWMPLIVAPISTAILAYGDWDRWREQDYTAQRIANDVIIHLVIIVIWGYTAYGIGRLLARFQWKRPG